jgi:hypothetical protein
MSRRSVLLLVLAGSGACSATPPPAPPVPVVEMPPIVAEPPPPDPTQPLALPRSPVRPPWREEAVAGTAKAFLHAKLVEAGQKAALVRSAGELFAIHEERGVIGPLVTPPDARWVGTDDQDRVYVATAAGELWIAEGPEDAAQGKLARAGAVAGATDWDFSAGIVAAVQGEKVLVSTDRGATFTPSTPRKGKKLRSVFTRFDGVVAARLQGAGGRQGEVYLSRDRGKTWQRSSFTPDNLRRDGAWIWNGSGDCPSVLSADGRGFTIDREAYEAFDGLSSWTLMFQASGTPEEAPRGQRLRVTSPLPPSAVGKKRQDPSRCREEYMIAMSGVQGGVVSGVLSLGLGPGAVGSEIGSLRTVTSSHKCAGAACIAGTVDAVPPPTRTGLAIFRDGACQVAPPKGARCPAGTPFARLPHVARIDQTSGQARVVALPSGCDPAGVQSAGGLGLLFCRSGDQATAVYTSAPGGSWAAEGTIPVVPHDLWATTQSADGSLMLHATCPRGAPCRAIVRSPRPPGDASAWRALVVPGALAYRVLDDGAALAVAAGTADRRFSLLLAVPGAEPKLVADVDAGERELRDLRVDADGHVIVAGSSFKGAVSWLVSAAGTLIDMADTKPAPRRGKPIEVVPRPLDPAHWP